MSNAEVTQELKPLPPEMVGFYVRRDEDGGWYFGRPKGPAIAWEKTVLTDLLNLGVQPGDVENIAPNVSYRARPTLVLIESL